MDDDILHEFLAESWENLARLDAELIVLEKNPGNSDLLDGIFRTVHSLKGTCGFIGLKRLGALAHSAENVLGQLRDGLLPVTPDAVSLILEVVDEIRSLLQGLEATREEPRRPHDDLVRRLDELATLGRKSPEPVSWPSAGTSLDDSQLVGFEPIATVAAAAPDTAGITPPLPPPPIVAASAPLSTHNLLNPSLHDGRRTSAADRSIRINVDILDSLMDLVGELVLTRNQLVQLTRDDNESKYAAPVTHLNRIATALHEQVMRTRMQPIGNAWSKLPRLIRELTQTTGKSIELETTGAETELDRALLDAVSDSLVHMVRNSADHGIETAEQRRNAGKPETGRIHLSAGHEDGHVVICIEDDGAGIDAGRVLQNAVEQGLVSEADAPRMSQNEILELVFRPGLTTAERITSISGRGVGMDVVRTAIERIGGTIELSSLQGAGTTVRMKIPLTLAVIPVLIVGSGRGAFAIPQRGVVELVRLPAQERRKIERIHDSEVLRLQNRLLPLVRLNDILGLDEPCGGERDVDIVVVQAGDEQFGLVVSEVLDTEEIVVKPVGSLLKDVGFYQGTAILGDGRIVMVLDMPGIANKFGRVGSNASPKSLADDPDSNRDADAAATPLLLFDAGEGTPMAVPLSLVARLEEIPRSRIERSGKRLMVQSGGDLLPLLPAAGRATAGSNCDPQPVVVFTDGRKSLGLMVGEILDIVQERLILRMSSQREGVLGTAIIGGRATDVIDMQFYLMQADPNWFTHSLRSADDKVLVVDDSLFFRQLVATALEAEGYRVTSLGGAVEAAELLEQGACFDAIVSDVDMPQMDGLEFAQWVRRNPQGRDTPLIALSSLDTAAVAPRAQQAGFDRYLPKFNAQQLLATIAELCQRVGVRTGVGA